MESRLVQPFLQSATDTTLRHDVCRSNPHHEPFAVPVMRDENCFAECGTLNLRGGASNQQLEHSEQS